MAVRGNCQECGYSFRLRKDGTVQTHMLYVGFRQRIPCPSDRHFPFFPANRAEPAPETKEASS